MFLRTMTLRVAIQNVGSGDVTLHAINPLSSRWGGEDVHWSRVLAPKEMAVVAVHPYQTLKIEETKVESAT